MKRLSVLMTFICVTCIAGYASDSFAAMSGSTVSTAAPIIGLGDGQTSGKLSFKTNLSVVTVNGQTGIFAGNFWSENVGWCTFDNLGADTAKLTGSSNVMPMTGFAWCQNAGWIKFNPT